MEVAHTAGLDLAGYRALFYDGTTGAVYKEADLNSPVATSDTNNGITFVAVSVYSFNSQVEDGPDGIAIVDPTNNVKDFIAYGKPFVALSGPAQGMTAQNIGVEEPEDTAATNSLQLGGSGYLKEDFTFQSVALATPGRVNTGQTIVTCTTTLLSSAKPKPMESMYSSPEEFLSRMFIQFLQELRILEWAGL